MTSSRPAIPVEVKREVLFQARHHCAVCCNPLPLEQAHVIPWSKSREHSVANLVADSRLETLRRDLEARNVVLNWRRDPALHDREIRLDNGWLIKIGRGLDIYHIPENWLSIEASDFSLRRCKQTKVDIFRE